MRERTWKLIYKSPGYGLRFFRRCIDGEPEAIPRVAVADNSGTTPDNTEDGILWLDVKRPWFVNDTAFSIPVVREQGKAMSWTGEGNGALFGLLDALRQPDVLGEEALKIKCALGRDANTGARAILKCLAMGVNP